MSLYKQERNKKWETLYDIWGKWESYWDSITPSSYSKDYQDYIINKMQEYLWDLEWKKILSIWSWNAIIESILKKNWANIICVDIEEQAIKIAKDKWLNSILAPLNFIPKEVKDLDLIYIDWVLVHILSNSKINLEKILETDYFFRLTPNWYILISWDEVSDEWNYLEYHNNFKDLIYHSKSFIEQISKNYYEILFNETYLYNRPISWENKRLISVLRKKTIEYLPDNNEMNDFINSYLKLKNKYTNNLERFIYIAYDIGYSYDFSKSFDENKKELNKYLKLLEYKLS